MSIANRVQPQEGWVYLHSYDSGFIDFADAADAQKCANCGRLIRYVHVLSLNEEKIFAGKICAFRLSGGDIAIELGEERLRSVSSSLPEIEPALPEWKRTEFGSTIYIVGFGGAEVYPAGRNRGFRAKVQQGVLGDYPTREEAENAAMQALIE